MMTPSTGAAQKVGSGLAPIGLILSTAKVYWRNCKSTLRSGVLEI
ncbi:MAG TPA: hypothetical protein VLJ79_34460 [Candidatus Binatia bacterium]|nr:hypothetical protein [Candidatus Binatia bacterium]